MDEICIAPAGVALGEEVLRIAREHAVRAFGPRLVSVYALGSLAHGGFCPAVSDVDVGFVLQDPELTGDGRTVDTLTRAVRARREPLADRLSVFWATPRTLAGHEEGGRFPPVDRADLREHGRLLWGRDIRDQVQAPSHDALVVAAADLALERFAGSEAMAQLRDPAPLVTAGPRALTKRVLFPVRFLYTAATGRIGLNADAAMAFLEGHCGPAADLVHSALAWRSQPFTLGEARALQLARAGLLPLYRSFAREYRPWLERAGAQRQAEAFAAWEERLDDA